MPTNPTPCPTVILPFGLWASTPAIAPLDPADIPTPDPPIGLEQFVMDNSPTDASSADGFDEIFTGPVALVGSQATHLSCPRLCPAPQPRQLTTLTRVPALTGQQRKPLVRRHLPQPT